MQEVTGPHRRRNPLTGEWVLVSPHRALRPWLGQQESEAIDSRPTHDPTCYLCPGNKRVTGDVNPEYTSTFVFRNDFSALLPVTDVSDSEDPLFQVSAVTGECRVICFSPRHDLTLADMDPNDIKEVVSTWKREVSELSKTYQWVQVFENKGEIMGCSNPHPHGQIWASNQLPTLVQREHENQVEYHAQNSSSMLIDVLNQELELGERIVEEGDEWVAWVPFWATWPFETLLAPKKETLRLTSLSAPQEQDLASVMKRLLCRYDNLFGVSFPYSMGWHGAPFIDGNVEGWQLHAHFYPPLLRSATVKKFMVGYEMLGESQRDITPEQAADRLRNASPRKS